MTTENKAPFISLIDGIDQFLNENGVPNAQNWKNGLPQEAYTTDLKLQRFYLNEQWRRILIQVEQQGLGNTMDERYCLVETGLDSDWFRLFRVWVIPCVLKHDLLTKFS